MTMKLGTIEDIQGLIEGRIEEGLTLEYKKILGNNKEIAKDVSAFANTDSGTIIYGIVERDRIPAGIYWIEESGVEEKIQNVVITHIHPALKEVKVIRLENPNNNKEAVYVVQVYKSSEAPHMANTRYYRRSGSVTSPMDDIQVRYAMFGSGRNAALRFEISQNLELATRTYKIIEDLYKLQPSSRKPIALIPFQCDAWNALVFSGLLSSFQQEPAQRLVETYRLIKEINSLIDWIKGGQNLWDHIDETLCVHTPADMSSALNAKYIPAIIRQQLSQLMKSLNEIVDLL